MGGAATTRGSRMASRLPRGVCSSERDGVRAFAVGRWAPSLAEATILVRFVTVPLLALWLSRCTKPHDEGLESWRGNLCRDHAGICRDAASGEQAPVVCEDASIPVCPKMRL